MNRLQPTQNTIKKLFSLSQNQCAFPGCSTPLYDTENDLLLGEICHIHSAGPGGERFDPGQSDEERRDISNLILLCANHHLTTNHIKKYTAEVLRKMKEDHEGRWEKGGKQKVDEKILQKVISGLSKLGRDSATPSQTEIDWSAEICERADLEDLDPKALLKAREEYKAKFPEEVKFLRNKKLIEGRYPRVFLSSKVAAVVGKKATYIKNRGLSKEFYKSLVIDYLKKFGSASRKEIDELLESKLPDILDEKQKKTKISNLLNEMANKEKIIKNAGSCRTPHWILV